MTTAQGPNSQIPQAIIDITRVVVTSLLAVEGATQTQRDSIALASEQLMRATVDLAGDAVAIADAAAPGNKAAGSADLGESVQRLKERAAEALQTLDKAPPASAPIELPDGDGNLEELLTGARQSIVQAYENAVTAQQRLDVLAEAALTQGITLLYSVVAAATGKAEAEKLKALLEATRSPSE